MRIGLMVPINNTTMEKELLEWLPGVNQCVTLRIPRGKGTLTLDDIPTYLSQTLSLAQSFSRETIDIMVYGCTAAGFLSGPERNAEIATSLSKITGKPTVTTAGSMVASLHFIGARNIALVTPYSDIVNAKLITLLNKDGINIRKLNSFRVSDVEELGKIDYTAVAVRARETMENDCDALFIACSQLPTYPIISELEAEFSRPVWSSIKATAWQVCQTYGLLFPSSSGG